MLGLPNWIYNAIMAFKEAMGKMEQEILQQILSKLSAMEENQKATNDRLTKIEEDIAELKESSQITRHSVNLLLNWAEKSDRIQNIGLYEKAE